MKIPILFAICLAIIITPNCAQEQATEQAPTVPTAEESSDQPKIVRNDDIAIDLEAEADGGQILEDWELHMKDFVPDEMLSFEVGPKYEEIFFEDIKLPTMIRGAFFVSYSSQEKIDFIIRDPQKKKIFQKINQRESVFSVNVTELGEYQFLFSNLRGKDPKQVTFAVDVHNTTEAHLSHTDLDPVEKKLDHIAIGIKDYLNEQRFVAKRQTTLLESIQKAQKRLMIFSVVEIALVILATAWQIYYIKKILDNKRIV